MYYRRNNKFFGLHVYFVLQILDYGEVAEEGIFKNFGYMSF